MPPITIYTKDFCPYCVRAKALLTKKGVTFTEIEAASRPEKRREMQERSGGRNTFPQIFIGTTHVGGCDDLHALDARGKLDPLLKGA